MAQTILPNAFPQNYSSGQFFLRIWFRMIFAIMRSVMSIRSSDLDFTSLIPHACIRNHKLSFSKSAVACVIVSLSLPILAQQDKKLDPACQTKHDSITRQIEIAESRGQMHRVRGLQEALAGVQANCTAESLSADQAQKIREQEEKVAERQRDLDEAVATGRSDKIQKRQEKLAQEQEELEQLLQQ